jgi:hypothetical protein
MRWDRLTLTALGGIAVFLIGAALLLEDAGTLFVPLFGMVGGIAALALYDGGLTLSITGATTLFAGDIAIAGDATLDTGTFAESGGFLGMSNGTLAVSGQATLSGGGLAVYGGTFDAGSLAFAGGSFGISGGDVTVTNQVSETAGTAGSMPAPLTPVRSPSRAAASACRVAPSPSRVR